MLLQHYNGKIVYFNNWDFENKDRFYRYIYYIYIHKLFSLE